MYKKEVRDNNAIIDICFGIIYFFLLSFIADHFLFEFLLLYLRFLNSISLKQYTLLSYRRYL